jgi:hypothetical protein
MNLIITEVGVVHGQLVEITSDVIHSSRVSVAIVVNTR